MEKDIQKLLLEAVELSHQLKDRAKKKRLVRELTALINGTFKDKEARLKLREMIGKKTEKSPIAKAQGGFEGFEEYQPGKTQPSQSKSSSQKNAATAKKTNPTKKKEVNKSTSKKEEIAELDEDEAMQILKMPNDKVVEFFGGIGKLKKFAKIQGITVNQRLKGDDYINPFKEELKKLLGIEPDYTEGNKGLNDEEE